MPPSRFTTPLALALAISAAVLAVVAVVAGNSGSTGLAALASIGAMVAAASGWLALRAARRLVERYAALEDAAAEHESSRRAFRDAVARLGAVARLRETGSGHQEQDRDSILALVTETAQQAVGADRVVFYEFVPAPDRLVARSGPGAPVGAVLQAGQGVAGVAAATRIGVVYPGETGVEPAPPEPERPTAMAVPFFSRGDLLGVVAVYGHPSRTFGPDDLSALETLVNQAGTAVDNVSLHQEAQRLSITDGLTGLWNRRQLELRCREELDRAVRFNRSVGLVFVDIDKFKSVNDDPEWLHTGGDSVLVEVARRLASATREIDVVARWGGEEFVLLLPETDLGGSLVLAEKVRQAVGDTPVTHAGKSRTVTVSAGVAAYPHSGTNVRTLDTAASAALHRAKHGGRNRVEQAEPNIRQAPPPAEGGAQTRDGQPGTVEGGTT
ncbi:MAG: sensor domain-containing diguanylate cyclase [Actinomycetota bacterium]|nr:sensor domain-containing diguanylate cyclase [Actinomycetota bacterium]